MKYITADLFQVLISERQLSEGLLEVLNQRSDLSLYRDALAVSVISTIMYLVLHVTFYPNPRIKCLFSCCPFSETQHERWFRGVYWIYHICPNRQRHPRIPQKNGQGNTGTTQTLAHTSMRDTARFWTMRCWFCFQDLNVTQYHIIVNETLREEQLVDGLYKDTLLGFSYQLGFFRQVNKASL